MKKDKQEGKNKENWKKADYKMEGQSETKVTRGGKIYG